MGFGLIRSELSIHKTTPQSIDYYNEQTLELTGVITEVDIRREKAKYTISVEDPTVGSLLISVDKYPEYSYGDRVKVFGKLQSPGEFNGFHYDNYLSRYNIYSVMYYPKIEVLETKQGNLFWHSMSFFQNAFLSRINQLFPEPHASFEAGLLVGARKGIPDKLMEKFNITGLTHIIAISGYNITIIIVFVMWALSGLPRRIGFIVAVITIILFTLFVGASPAVVRASIMGILGLLALNTGRQTNINITILFTAFLMVLINPKILWWDVGFQLSFAAVLGLIYIAPHFEKMFNLLPKTLGIREAIMMTMSAQVTALPIIVFNFERLSLIAPIANVLVVFAIPPAMLFGFVAVLLSIISKTLGLLIAYIAWGILSYIIYIIEITSIIPYASINLPGMKIWMVVIYYLLLISLLYLFNHKKTGNRTQDTAS